MARASPAQGYCASVSWHQLGTAKLMMLHSLAGLAAQAVNEHRGDEMLWISTDYADVEDWFGRLLQSHRQIEVTRRAADLGAGRSLRSRGSSRVSFSTAATNLQASTTSNGQGSTVR